MAYTILFNPDGGIARVHRDDCLLVRKTRHWVSHVPTLEDALKMGVLERQHRIFAAVTCRKCLGDPPRTLCQRCFQVSGTPDEDHVP